MNPHDRAVLSKMIVIRLNQGIPARVDGKLLNENAVYRAEHG
jgi:hypothetical protein